MTGHQPARPARAVATYSVARLLVFLGVGGVFYLAGLRGVLLVLVAVAGSGLVSFVVLARQRVAMAVALEPRLRGRTRSLSARIAAANAAEDAYADALERRPPDAASPDGGRHPAG